MKCLFEADKEVVMSQRLGLHSTINYQFLSSIHFVLFVIGVHCQIRFSHIHIYQNKPCYISN